VTGKHFNIMADYDGSVTITATTSSTTHLLELIQENKSKGLIRQVGGNLVLSTIAWSHSLDTPLTASLLG